MGLGGRDPIHLPRLPQVGSPLASFPQRVLLLFLPTPLPPPTSHSLYLISHWDCTVSLQAVYGGQIKSCMASWLGVGSEGSVPY